MFYVAFLSVGVHECVCVALFFVSTGELKRGDV